MPPALSDYDSDGSLIYNTIEAENVKEPPSAVSQSPARHSSAPAPSGKFVKQSLRPDTRSATVGTSHSSSRFSSSTKSPAFASFEKPKSLRGKKRSALLAGIGPENIISQSENEEEALAKNTPPTSSISTSSYRTRRQVHGSQKSEVCYDQKYHPMDDVMNPTRAAKVKSKYGEELPVSDDILFFSDVDDGGNESDVEMHIDAEPMKKVKNKFCQPTRRSGRQMNNSVIYNTSVHPQDNDIEEGERTDWVLEVSRKRKKIEDVGSDDDDEVNVTQARKDSAYAMELTVIADSDMSDSESPADASEPNDISVERNLHKNVRKGAPLELKARKVLAEIDPYPYVKGLPFTIHSDTEEQHAANMAAAPTPEDFDEHDKENDRSHTDFEETEDPLAGITVGPASNAQHVGQADADEHDTVGEFLHYLNHETYVPDNEQDSVLEAISSGHMGLDGATLPGLDTSSFIYVDMSEFEDEDQIGESELGSYVSIDTEETQ